MIYLRNASLSDAGRILDIYRYYVEHTAVSFECEAPSLEEFTARMQGIMETFPYIVICEDDRTEGYAYAKPFVGREGYRWSCETSIYLDRTAHRRGLGRRLYEALEEALRAMGVLNMYARIAYPEKEDEWLTTNSADFHAHLGFVKAGEYHKCAYKFGRWYNMICMEKEIGAHSGKPVFLPYRECGHSFLRPAQ